jgi:DNA polymerase-3 subunit epsilon
MREIALDTETTGLSHAGGHRIVEIGCVELINKIPTGRTYHQYINPERLMHPDATAVSGITDEHLRSYPVFARIADEFYNFIKDSTLVIHNASFDIGFINSEFARVSLPLLNVKDAIDTVQLSRKKFPGQAANLDAICKRFGIDLSKRTKHGALIDAQLLAEVYIMLLGGRQGKMFKEEEIKLPEINLVRTFRPARNFAISEIQMQQHSEFVKNIKNAIWLELDSLQK